MGGQLGGLFIPSSDGTHLTEYPKTGVLLPAIDGFRMMAEGGSIILDASIAPSKGLQANAVYSATNAAVVSFARTTSTDLRKRQIRVNAVSPGSTDTPGSRELVGSSEVDQERVQTLSSAISDISGKLLKRIRKAILGSRAARTRKSG